MNGKGYTTNEIKDILDLYFNQNKSIKDIALATGRTEKGIVNAISRHRDMCPDKTRVKTPNKINVEVPNMDQDTKELVDKILKRSEDNEVRVIGVEKPSLESEKTKPMSPREMIKHLYSLGYRIKDNGLVVLIEQRVNIKDIING